MTNRRWPHRRSADEEDDDVGGRRDCDADAGVTHRVAEPLGEASLELLLILRHLKRRKNMSKF